MDEKKIREALKELRFRLRLSQQEFAARVSKSYSSIQRYEGKEAPPALELAAFWELAEQEGHRDLAEVLFDALVTAIPARLKERLSSGSGGTYDGSVTGEHNTRKGGMVKTLDSTSKTVTIELPNNPVIIAWVHMLVEILTGGLSVIISALCRNIYVFRLTQSHAGLKVHEGFAVPSPEEIATEHFATAADNISRAAESFRKMSARDRKHEGKPAKGA